jgi:hypothetical protein
MRGFRKRSGSEPVTAFSRTEMVDVAGDDFFQRGIGSDVGAADGILLQESGARGITGRTLGLGADGGTVLRSSLPEAPDVIHYRSDHGDRDHEGDYSGKESEHQL